MYIYIYIYLISLYMDIWIYGYIYIYIYIYIFFEAVTVPMCSRFPRLLKTHFFIYFENLSQPFQ